MRYYQRYDYTKCAWAKVKYENNEVVDYKRSKGKYKHMKVKQVITARRKKCQ